MRLVVRDLGRLGYADAVALQDSLAEARMRDEIPDTLLLLEHPPVVTLGRRATAADILVPESRLAELGIEVHSTTRGGLATYHGPGQLVGYPIVKLRARGLSVPGYVHALELAVIASLASIGVPACVDAAHVGVWTARGKIAAIGIAQRHGVTLHGFAVNLQPDLSHFALINPCGIGELGVTSAAAILDRPVDLDAFKHRVASSLEAQLAARCND